MEEIRVNGRVFAVDREKTERYYRSNTLCDCEDCRLFQRRIRERYPVLTEYLALFGIDVSRPDETAPVSLGDGVLYIMSGYTVCGYIVNAETDQVSDHEQLIIEFEEGFQFPNEQEGEYFSVTVNELKLPFDEEYKAD
ncbi:MAG: hypothetical protein IJM63_02665 [Solobacterium sp.]|nr:hypothetical protein [Solobacterium sp.]